MRTLTMPELIGALQRLSDLEPISVIADDLRIPPRALDEQMRPYGFPNWADVDASLKRLLREQEAREPMTEQQVQRGLAAAGPLPEDGATTSERLVRMPLYLLEPDPDNPRADASDDVEDLMASIKANGLLQPIVARMSGSTIDHEHPLIIVAGHRRYAALTRLGYTSTQVIVREQMSSDDVLAAMLVENSQRRDLHPLDEARAIKRLMATRKGMSSPAQVAQGLGRSKTWVTNRLALLELSPAVQDKMRAGEVQLGDAVQLSRMNAGRVRKPRAGSNSKHFGHGHDLAERARRRCTSNNHTGYRVGLVACGECWEAVIRADERAHIHEHSAAKGVCATCNREMP